jgi:hypothetical protein
MATLTFLRKRNNIKDSGGLLLRINRYVRKANGMAANDKPNEKAEKDQEPEKAQDDNLHLRDEKDAAAKPEDKPAQDKKEAEKPAEKPEVSAEKGDKATASQTILQGLSPQDYFATFKKTSVDANNKALTGLELAFPKDAPTLNFDKQSSSETLMERMKVPANESAEVSTFSQAWNALKKSFNASDFFKNEGAGEKTYLSEKMGISGRFCDPFSKGEAFKFDNGMCVAGFQPALAGAEGRTILKDFGFDKLDSKDESGWWDGLINGLESSVASGLDKFNTIRAKISNTVEDLDLSFGLGDRSVDSTVAQLKKSMGAEGQRDAFDRFAETSATQNAEKFLGSAKVNFDKGEVSYDAFKVKDSTVQVTAGKDQITHTIKSADGERVVVQGRPDENGKRTFETTVNDTTYKQDKNGIREISNANSDINLRQKADGAVEVFDKSGKKIADFDKEGDAKLYFNNAITEVVKPGESIESAYARLQKEHGDDIKGKPVLIVDGKGESLKVEPDGRTVRNHANGNAEMVFKAKDANGQEHEIHVKVRTGPHGQFIKLSKTANGEEMDVNDKRVTSFLKGSMLDVQNGKLLIEQAMQPTAATTDIAAMPNNTAGGDKQKPGIMADANSPAAQAEVKPAETQTEKLADGEHHRRRHHYKELLQNGVINWSHDTKINTITGAITQRDGDKEMVITPNKETGVAVAQTFKLKEDGTRESEKPIQTMTFDHGKTTIQGTHPNDIVRFDAKTQELNAFNTVRTKPGEDAEIRNEHGEIMRVNQDGDFHAFDRNGHEIAASDGDRYTYDEGRSAVEYRERLVEQQTEASRDAISDASAVLSEVASMLGRTDIPSGAIGVMRGNLAAIRAKCGALGIAIPGEVTAAECAVNALEMKAAVDNKVGQVLMTVNMNTTTLRDLAGNFTGTPDQQANALLRAMGIALPNEKRH